MDTRKLRNLRRATPENPATVAFFKEEGASGYGAVINVSETGVCVATNETLPIGGTIHLKFSFYNQERFLETEGKVIWIRDGGTVSNTLQDSILHGFVLTNLADEEQNWWNHLICSPQFSTILTPQSEGLAAPMKDGN